MVFDPYQKSPRSKEKSFCFQNLAVDWNDKPTGIYTQDEAVQDFGTIKKWDQTKANIATGKDGTNGFTVKLLPNKLSSGGYGAEVDIEDGTEYEIEYDMKFHSQFNFSRGGKNKLEFSIRVFLK